MLQCVAARCSVLQCVAVCCSAQCVPCTHICMWILQRVAVFLHCGCSVLQCIGCSVCSWLYLDVADSYVDVAVCCSVLQRIAVCYSVLRSVAVCWSVLQRVAVLLQCMQYAHVLHGQPIHTVQPNASSILQHVAACCSMLQHVAACCSVLQHVAVCCSVLQCIAYAHVVFAQPIQK